MRTSLDSTPPNDPNAEIALLGLVMTWPKAYAELSELGLRGADFYSPAHEQIWQAVAELASVGKPAEPMAVLGVLQERGQLERIGGAAYLHSCVAAGAVAGSLTYYAERVIDLSTQRGIREALDRAWTVTEGSDRNPEQMIEKIEEMLRGVSRRSTIQPDDFDTLMTLDEFVDRDLGPIDWLIPDILAKGERLIITAEEGVGKSMMLRQLGACIAAGMHPFTGRFGTPHKVLYVDIENPERIMQDKLGDIRRAVRAHGANPGDRFWVERRQQGLHLDDPAARRWLKRRLDVIRPDALIVGPVYKLYVGGAHNRDEDLAAFVTSTLDEIRTEYDDMALILEAHAPKAVEGGRRRMEPIGSSLWMRWPEFGIGLAKANHPAAEQRRMVDVVSWRGPRTERRWPARLESGGEGLPWIESRL